jgi:hypothetical protein
MSFVNIHQQGKRKEIKRREKNGFSNAKKHFSPQVGDLEFKLKKDLGLKREYSYQNRLTSNLSGDS